jgi:selenide,water dikinase
MSNSTIRLTQTVKKGGCAAKIPAMELRKVLAKLVFPPGSPELLVDGSKWDDAAVYAISETQAMVQTLDFFTPIVDSPKLFGKVAAANALSDVYAMGGIPKTCLAILAYPAATFETEVVCEVLQGACDIISEAGAHLVGGHSIDDDTLKFGLSVTGFVNRDQIWTNAGAKVGDQLILTKALGTGTLTAGLKRAAYTEEDIKDALSSMCQINHIPNLLSNSQLSKINAATDITGFGLSGHSSQMARASNVSFEMKINELPVFLRTFESLKKEHLTKAHATNKEYTKERITISAVDPLKELLLHDPQTSGGLLLSVAADGADEILKTIQTHFPSAKIIGKVISQRDRDISFV